MLQFYWCHKGDALLNHMAVSWCYPYLFLEMANAEECIYLQKTEFSLRLQKYRSICLLLK